MNNQQEQSHERLSIDEYRELLDEQSKKNTAELAITMRNVIHVMTEDLLGRLLQAVREARQNGGNISLPNQQASTSAEQSTKPARISAPKQKATKPNPCIQGYLRPAEAAQYLGIAPRTLSHWMRSRIIPYHKIARKVCLLRKADLDVAMGRYRTNAVGDDFQS